MINRRKQKEFENVSYSRLRQNDGNFTDAQFAKPVQKIPWKAISLAAVLFVSGLLLLVIGSLIISGYIDAKYADRMWPMIILGILMFIPGAYHMQIAYYAFKKVPGYSFNDIPEFE